MNASLDSAQPYISLTLWFSIADQAHIFPARHLRKRPCCRRNHFFPAQCC